jgi:hypothetical protein
MAKNVSQLIQVAPDFQIRRGAVKNESGLTVQKKAKIIFDFSALDSAGVANSAIGTHGSGVFLPTKAIITRAYWQINTGFTSASNTATIAINSNGAGDIKAATIVSNAAYVAAGFQDGVPTGAASAFIACTAEREITFTVATQALTAGKLTLFIEYAIGA